MADGRKVLAGLEEPAVLSIRSPGKAGVILVANAGCDGDGIDRLGDLAGRCGGGQQSALGVVQLGLGDLCGGQRHQAVGAFQKAVLNQGLIDLAQDIELVGDIGQGRVEVFEVFAEGLVQDVFCGLLRPVGIIGAGRGQGYDEQPDRHGAGHVSCSSCCQYGSLSSGGQVSASWNSTP